MTHRYASKNMSEGMLLALLDNKEMPVERKTMIRNIMVPAFEAVENCNTPQEVMETVEMIIRIIVPATAFGLSMAIIPDKLDFTQRLLSEGFYRDLVTHAKMIKDAAEQARAQRQKQNDKASY